MVALIRLSCYLEGEIKLAEKLKPTAHYDVYPRSESGGTKVVHADGAEARER
jgi:hypothetical protein